MGKIEDVAAGLRKELENGKYEPGERFPSEYELAERFGVNNKTANKAVAMLVAEGLLRRGCRGEGTLVKQTSAFPKMFVGYIGSTEHPYYAEVFYGFQQNALNHDCIACAIAPQPEKLGGILRKLRLSGLRGFGCSGFGIVDTSPLPVLYLEDQIGNEKYPDFVACDSFQGGYSIMKEILAHGHRDIVMFATLTSNSKRTDGMLQALAEAGVKNPAKRLFILTEWRSPDYHIMITLRKALEQFPHFTAAATASDNIAFHLCRNLEKLGIEWQGKIAVTGFGNVRGISDRLPIATVDQHPFTIGFEAFHALMEMIESGTPQRKYIETELANTHFIPDAQ